MPYYTTLVTFIVAAMVFPVSSISEGSGQQPDPIEVTMSCDRKCLTECNMKFTGTFATGSNEGDIPHDHCYDKERVESMAEEDRDKCVDSKDKVKQREACHTKLLMSDQDSLPSNVKNEQSYCHLTNNEDPLKYYPSVLANINADEEKCVTECHAKCEICWSKDNCVPVCQEDKEYKIDGFIQSECARPFYFCNAQLSVNKIVIDNTKVTKKFHVGVCTIDPALPVFLSIASILLLMFIAYKLRNQIKACFDN